MPKLTLSWEQRDTPASDLGTTHRIEGDAESVRRVVKLLTPGTRNDTVRNLSLSTGECEIARARNSKEVKDVDETLRQHILNARACRLV